MFVGEVPREPVSALDAGQDTDLVLRGGHKKVVLWTMACAKRLCFCVRVLLHQQSSGPAATSATTRGRFGGKSAIPGEALVAFLLNVLSWLGDRCFDMSPELTWNYGISAGAKFPFRLLEFSPTNEMCALCIVTILSCHRA